MADLPVSTLMLWSIGRWCGSWLYWGMFWLLVAPSVGVALSGLFNFPDYLGDSLGLTFGRLRPVHVNGVIFGAFSALFIGECYYLVPRLCGVRCPGRNWACRWPGCGISLRPPRSSRCRSATTTVSKRASFRSWPRSRSSSSVAVITAQFLITIGRRLEPPLYVALWYLIGAFVWTTMNLVLGTPSCPT